MLVLNAANVVLEVRVALFLGTLFERRGTARPSWGCYTAVIKSAYRRPRPFTRRLYRRAVEAATPDVFLSQKGGVLGDVLLADLLTVCPKPQAFILDELGCAYRLVNLVVLLGVPNGFVLDD